MQIGIVYFFGGVSKLNGDWLRGEPMRHWLAERTDVPLVGPLFREDWLVMWLAYGGLLFDLAIVPLLLWRRMRLAAFAVALVFHLLNARLWTIGVFPWLMIAATLLFFPPDWPRRVGHRLHRLVRRPAFRRHEPLEGGTTNDQAPSIGAAGVRLSARERATVALIAGYAAVQFTLPLSHWFYPGPVQWTGEGHRFGWHMLHRRVEGVVLFDVRDPATGQSVLIDPRQHLAPHQYKQLPGRPDLLLDFSHLLGDEMSRPGGPRAEVRARTLVSLNGRKPQPLVDQAVDLAAEPRTLRPKRWILPLTEPLPH